MRNQFNTPTIYYWVYQCTSAVSFH